MALDTISRRKISWSEYKNFLITGKMFSVVTPILPFCIILFVLLFEVSANCLTNGVPKEFIGQISSVSHQTYCQISLSGYYYGLSLTFVPKSDGLFPMTNSSVPPAMMSE